MQTQVDSHSYSKKGYNSLERFISYHHQIDSILEFNPESVLEIGVGSQVCADYIRRQGIKVTTCDFEADLKPDIIADVRSIPVPDKSHDVVAAFQILEHIPFTDFPKALSELSRIAKKSVVISVPYRSSYVELIMKFPGTRTLFKRNFLELFARFPLKFAGFQSSGQHHWEIDSKNYSLSKVRKVISEHLIVKKEFSPALNKFHYFFICTPRQ